MRRSTVLSLPLQLVSTEAPRVTGKYQTRLRRLASNKNRTYLSKVSAAEKEKSFTILMPRGRSEQCVPTW